MDRSGRRAQPDPARLRRALWRLIEEYNASSLNVDELLRRLHSLASDLSADEQRTVREHLSEAELAIVDLLI